MTNEAYPGDSEYQGAIDVPNEHEQEAPGNRERILGELKAIPLSELTAAPETVDCAKAAIEKNLGVVDLPVELALLKGVRIDDIGVADRESANDVDTMIYGVVHKFRQGRQRRDMPKEVGTFNSNNGVVEYIDHLGHQYVAPGSVHLFDALREAGYGQGDLWVNCSNGAYPADTERARAVIQAQEVARQLDVLKKLQAMGIDKMDEVGDIIGELSDPTSEASRRVEEQVGWADQYIAAARTAYEEQRKKMSADKRNYRQDTMREAMIAEGALPAPEQPAEDSGNEVIA